jgi:hypothetical protein
MPIYHFHVEDSVIWPDAEGCDLPDLDVAIREAVALAGELIREQSARFWQRPHWRLSVTDADDRPLCSLQFTGVLAAEAATTTSEM